MRLIFGSALTVGLGKVTPEMLISKFSVTFASIRDSVRFFKFPSAKVEGNSSSLTVDEVHPLKRKRY